MQPTGNQSAGKPSNPKQDTPINAIFEFFERNNVIIVPVIILVLIIFFILVIDGNHQRTTTSSRIDTTAIAQATEIAFLSTQDHTLNMQLDQYTRRILDLEQTVQVMQTQVASTQTPPPPEPPEWDATDNEGFKNDVVFNADENTISLDENPIKSTNGYIYIPIENIELIKFNILINNFPFLLEENDAYQETDKNYRLIVGVGEIIDISNNTKVVEPYVQARIYPAYRKWRWNCCEIISQSSFLKGGELTQDIEGVVFNQMIGIKVEIEEDLITLSVNGEPISSSVSAGRFDHPVVYIGYFQAEECDSLDLECHVDFELHGLEPPVRTNH